MFVNKTVEWPSLGYWPGFKSLATEPKDAFNAPYQGLGDVALPGGFSLPFPLSLDLSSSVTIDGFDVPIVALVGVAAVAAFSLLGGKAKRAYRGRRAVSSSRAAKVAGLRAQLAAAQA